MKPRAISLRNLSIRKQLPLLICLLLVIVIALFGAISYLGVRRAALAIGQQRLKSLTEQLSGMFQQNMRTLEAGTKMVAGQRDILDYMEALPGNRPAPEKAIGAMQKLLADSQSLWVELRDQEGRVILAVGKEPGVGTGRSGPSGERTMKVLKPDVRGELLEKKVDSSFAGKFYQAGDSMYFPIVVRVSADGRSPGYIVRWRPVRATPDAIAQLSQLIGSRAAFYFGNADGSLWTDLLRPLPPPTLAAESLQSTVHYRRQRDGEQVIAYSRPIIGTKWTILVELSQTLVLETANRFLYWMIGIGALLVVTGSLIAWLISRSFTRPLEQLQRATAAIAAGNFSSTVDIHRRDELGKLAASFNSMADQVHHTREDLENRVKSRTLELEAVNKELEAFSYSVSHDLRAPLRAVSGYTMMLKEDYEESFDAEARRITDNILSNVKMMGRLIDDLIGFSRLGKREVRRQETDMKMLAQTCIAELSPLWPEEKFLITIDPLPSCKGDEDLLKQVWMNLIGNALKYSSKKEIARIAVGSMHSAEGTAYFVRDNGAGFDMRYADKLFKVFQRLHSQEEFEGTGVGLALVKRIVDKHEGDIWAESSPGQGSIFYFRLPA